MVAPCRFRIPVHTLRGARRVAIPALGLVLAASLTAQQLIHPKPGEAAPTFEVAAVRPDDSGPNHSSIDVNNDSFQVENVSLHGLIQNAFGARTKQQIEGGPDKLMDERFDINARIAQDDLARLKKLDMKESERQKSLMLQELLLDRFHLKVHVESREVAVLALVLAKGGPRFRASAPPPAAGAEDASAPPDKGKPHWQGTSTSISDKGANLEAHAASMDDLADILSDQPETSERYVIDRTGLAGVYDYSLRWTPENMTVNVRSPETGAQMALDTGGSGPSLFSALESQLGLKLESQKAPVETLVIDQVEAPSPN
jgi:uncharacterized protein (TIGR03435 family)